MSVRQTAGALLAGVAVGAAGSTVTWTNRDDEPHTIVSDSGPFHSAALDSNESFSFRFDKPGTYRYTCSIHPCMAGTILVR
jgi:plastocyanin